MNVNLHLLPKLETKIYQYISEGKFEEALDLGKQLLSGATEIEDYDLMMKATINLIGCYYHLGQIENAFNSFVEYKKIYDQHGNKIHQFHLYNLSALIFEYAENYEKAKEMVEESIDIAVELDMHHEASVIYNTYATYLIFEGNYQKAEELCLISLDLVKKHCPGDVLLQCQIHMNMALAHIEMNQLEEVKTLLESLENNPYIQDHPYEKGYYLYVYGMYFLKANELHSALKYLQESYDIYTYFQQEVMLRKVLKAMISLYEKLEDYCNAYAKMKEYVASLEKTARMNLSCKLLELDIKNNIAAIEKRANVDGLTGVYNRYYLEKTCNQWLAEAKKKGEAICCIIFDVDDFKDINDTFGHLIGDEVIKTVAQKTMEVFNDASSIVGRYGGDEFIVFIKDCTIKEMMDKAKQLYYQLTTTSVTYLKNQIQITISMGVVSSESLPNARKFAQLFKLADQALYMAKNEGKNQIVSLSRDNCAINLTK